MKEKTRRIIALLCAVCLLASGEGRLCLTALAAMARPASYAVDTAVEDAAVRDEAPGDAEAEPAELAENDMDSESMYYAAAGEDIAADAAAVSAEAEAVVSDVESVDNDSNTVLSNSVLTAEWDIYRVKVTYNENSGIPEDAELVVREVTENNDPNFADYLSVGAGLVGLDTDGISDESVPIAKAFDISLRSKATGEEYQPTKDMKVEISIPHYKLADNMQVSVVHFAEKLSEELQEELRQEAYAGFSDEEREVYDELSEEERDVYISLSYEQREVYADLSEVERLVYAGLSDEDRAVYVDLSDEEREEHGYVLDDESVDDEELLTVLNSIPQLMEVDLINNTAAFTTDGFSVFVVLGYTVDFHWGEYTFSMEGGTTLLLSELLETIVAGADTDAVEARELLEDFSVIRNVEFSNPELLTVDKVDREEARQALKKRAEALIPDSEDDAASGEPEAIEYTDDSSWQDYDREEDWLLTSIQSFETEEKLTITLTDGRIIDIRVTDPQTVTYQGFIYSINNQRTGATITRRASGYSNLSRTAVLPGTINGVKVISAPYTVFPAGSSTLVEESYVNTLFPDAINVPDLIVTNPEVEALNADSETKKGAENDTSMTQIWKKSEVNANGDIEITISFFQKQGKPIDFILVCDETGSMANAATANVGGTNLTAPRFMWARAAILKATRALLDANHKAIPYSNEVAFLVWDNRAQLYSDFYNDYDTANNWMKNQYTGHNGTNHTQTIQTLLGMVDRRRKANAASGRDAEIVIVYLSDFADGGLAADNIVFNGVRDQARKLFNANAVIYGLNMFGGTTVNDRQKLISRQGHNYVAGSNPSKLLPAFEAIINDAISNADSDMTIEDELSPALKGQADTNRDSLDGGTAADSSNDTSSEAATYADGRLNWNLSNGQTSQTIEGETVTSTKTLKTGQVYHKTITIPITDAGWGDNAYTGQMPTNGSLVLKDKNGNSINSVGVEEGKDGSPLGKTPVKFRLGLIDTSGSQTNYPIGGIKFTIAEQGNSDAPKEYTTGNDGVFVVPYDGTDGILFERGKTYVLTEVTSSVNEYNGDDPVHMVFAPVMKELVNDETVPSHWLLSVNDDFSISTATADEANTSYTPALTITSGVINIWNNERVDAKLIPITVTKTWVGNGARFDVPFTIYGVDESGRYPLTAYSSSDQETAQTITSLKESEVVKTSDASGEVWTREVYVFNKIGDHEFYTSVMVKTQAGHTYTPSMAGKEKFETNQSYSYQIEEGEFPDEFKYGYYRKETPTQSRTPSVIIDDYYESTGGQYVDVGSGDYFLAQIHINVNLFKLFDNIIYGNSGNDDYRKSSNNTMSDPKKLYTHLRSVEMEVHSAKAGETVTQAKIHFNVSNVPDTLTGVLFQNIHLPKEWENYDTTDNGRNLATHAYNYTDLIIDNLVFIDDKGNRIVMQGGNNILHHGLYDGADNSITRLAIEKNGANTSSHNSVSVTNSDITLNQKYIAASSTAQQTSYDTAHLTLAMENTEIPLQEVELKKVWQLNGHAEQLPSDDVLTTWVYGKNNSGASTGHVLPVYLDPDRADNDGKGFRPYDLHVDEDTRTTEWKDTVYIPTYEISVGDITGYTASEEEMTVKEDTADGEGEPGKWGGLSQSCENKTREETTTIIVTPAVVDEVQVLPSANNMYLLFNLSWSHASNVTDIELEWKENGYTYSSKIKTTSFSPNTIATYAIKFKKSTTDVIAQSNIISIRINGEEYIDNMSSYSISDASSVLYSAHSATSTSETRSKPAVTQEVTKTISYISLTLTNTFNPNPSVKIISSFTDETDDRGSTQRIKKVRYRFLNTDASGEYAGKSYDLEIPLTSSSDSKTGGNRTRYLPQGNYAVTQMSLILENDLTVTINPEYNPYAVTITNAAQDATKITGAFTVNPDTAGGLDITYDNIRKNYPVTVQMEWHPPLDADEDPLKENDPSQKKAEYTLQYYSLVGGSEGTGGFENTEERGVLSARTPVRHDGAVPVFSVDGRPLKCDLGGEDTVEGRLPDYDLTIKTEEVATGIDAAPTRLIYTFVCDLKQTRLSVNKTWQFEDQADKSARDALDPRTVTLSLKRVDGKPFRIGSDSMTEKLITLPTDGRVIDDLTWVIEIEGIDVSKSYIADSAYVLEETRIGSDAAASSAFEPVYEDVIPSESHEFNVTKADGHDKDARFRLIRTVNKGEPDPGTILSVTNREVTTSFTVKKLWKDIRGNEVNASGLKTESSVIELYGIKYSSGSDRVEIPDTYKDQDGAVTMLNGHAGNSLVGGSMKLRDFGDYQIDLDNLTTEDGKSIWSLTIGELPASYTYYVVERTASGEALAIFALYTEGENEGRLQTSAKTDEADLFMPKYAYTPATENSFAQVVITNTIPYICKIEENVNIGGEDVVAETPFATLNKALNYARQSDYYTMDADHSVAIQMLVDYVIPSTDKVLLNSSTDNIIITTAATSGGVYNFVKTFTAADGRKAYVAEVKDDEGNVITPESGDRNDVAILKRGYNGRSLFVVNNASASLTTAMITFDGSNKAYGADGKYTTGGTTYTCDTSDGGSGHGGIISVPAGTLNLNEDSTLRNSKAVQGGAVCVKGRLTESGAKLLDNYAVGDGSTPAYGGAVCLESGAEATFRDVYIDGHSTMTIYKAGDVKDGKQLTAEEADAANRADAAAVDANADRGGGVYISANATLEFHGGELIKLRAATNGGAIDNLGKLTMAEDDQAGSAHADIEGSMEHCSATNGGAIYNGVSGTINMTGGLIHHCIAAENGGGIFTESKAVIAGKDMAIDMHTEGGKPGVISDCEAVNGNGGGIYVKAGKLDMTGGEIRGCKAIAPKNANGKVIVSVDSDTYETTCASGKGGGVYNLGTVILATASDHPGRIDNCSADFAGGGIYTTGSGSMSITGGEMDDNRAGYYGGAIYDDTIRRESDTADLLIQGIIIRGHVNLDKDTVNAQKGGAIYVANGNLDLRDRGSGESAVHTQIYDCTASENGGAIYHIFNQHIHKNSEGGRKTTLTLTDVVIDGHDKLDGSTKNARYGGAIFVFNGCDNGGSHSGHDRFKMPNGNIVKLNQFPGPNIIIDGGKIADCTADVNGGAIYCDSPVEGQGKNTISLQNGTVINGHESLGADIWNANCNDTTPNANQTNLGGGAIYFKRGTLKVGNKEDTEPVKILNCTARNFGGAVFGLPSGTNIDEDGYKYTAKLENCLIDGHAAGTTLAADDVNAGLGGGAVYMKMSTVSIENSTLRNLRAPYGAAILGRTNDSGTQACTVTIDGGRIENNIATADKGGAVNAMSGLAIKDAGEDNSVDRAAAGFPVLKETNQTKWAVCTFRLEGDAVIYNNFGVGNFASQQKNLVLTRHRAETPTTEVGDTNAIINTTENGLTEDAHIGVYVTGADGMDGSAESEPYELHGGYEDDFGTYISSANLHKFTNDRNGMYGAVCTLIDGNHTPDKGHNKSEKIIRWESYLCKLTDDSGSLLFITAPGGWAGSRVIDGTTYYPAVFRTLTEAFNAMKGVAADGTSELKLYKADGNEYTIGSDIQLHMLRNYEQPGTDRPLFEADRKLAFTTAKKQANTNTGYSNGDVYIYSKGSFANADDTRATILRGKNGTAGDASMLTIPDSAPTELSLTLRNIIFDGNNYTHTGPGGIINARMGDLTVTTGSILRNAIATDKGGAIEKINGNFIMDGDAQVVNCAAQHGGGVHLEALTKCEIGGSDVKITGNKANNGCGGGIFIHSSPAVFEGKLTISDCHADAKGGGVNIGWGDASLTVEGENVKILNCDAKKEQEGQSSDGGGGLNIETGRNVSFGKLTISGCYTDGKGGAVRLEENATMTMNDGTIEKNKVLAGGEGAGIYVSQGSTLKLSGSPGFGSGSDANTAALDGYSTKENGGAAYGSDTVRQDIYLAETGAESTTDEKYDPASIIVTGDITSGDSSIWVWAEDQYRYKQLMPFAKMETGVKFAESPTGSQLDAAHLKAFRNAQDDETTENGTDTYLYGTIEGEKTDAGIIYWTGVTGSRKVILRKVGTTYTSMSGKTFKVFKGTGTLPYVVKQGTKRTQLGELDGTPTDTTVTVDPMTSQSSGVIWIGNLPYGWYIIEEKDPHKYSYLVVTANGTFGTPQKVTENDVVKEGGYDSLANAQAAAKALYDAKK